MRLILDSHHGEKEMNTAHIQKMAERFRRLTLANQCDCPEYDECWETGDPDDLLNLLIEEIKTNKPLAEAVRRNWQWMPDDLWKAAGAQPWRNRNA